MKMKKIFIVFAAMALCMLPINQATAAIVTINSPVTGPVAGNGTGANGTAPFAAVADDNTLNFLSGAVLSGAFDERHAYGGYSPTIGVNADNNTVNLSGGVSSEWFRVYGGRSINNTAANTGNANGNTVNVNGAVGSSIYIFGGHSNFGAANDNTVNFYDGSAGSGSTNGAISDGSNKSCISIGNTVNFYSGSVYGIMGANGYGVVTGNTVNIIGGTVIDRVIGAESSAGDVTGNVVNISGGKVATNYVYAGLSYTGNATGNTLNISGSPTIGAPSAFIKGGNSTTLPIVSDLFTDNTLNKDSSVAVAGTFSNFEFINFGYGGNAGISTLDTTPTGDAAQKPVKLNTAGNDIDFSGNITGTGSLTKTGAGTLTLSGSYSATGGDITVVAGTLANNTGGPLTVNGQIIVDGETFTAGAPVVVSAIPTGSTGVAVSGDIIIMFSKVMDVTTTGTVQLDGVPLAGGAWSHDDRVFTVPYSGLTHSTTYTVKIFAFKDIMGNMMTTYSNAFVTADPLQKTVTVGMQNWTLTAAKSGTVTFPVTTANIADGSYAASVANLPVGVTVVGNVTIVSNSGILTLSGNNTTVAGITNTLTLTIDGTTSAAFILNIKSASSGGGCNAGVGFGLPVLIALMLIIKSKK